MRNCTGLFAASLFALVFSAGVTAEEVDQAIAILIRDYDVANYQVTNEDARAKAMDTLIQRADNLAKRNPALAEPLVWKGILEADQSAAQRSLGQVKQARKTLEAAIAITPNQYAADAHSTLGSMYANVPGFPLAFGDKKKARAHLQRALALNATHVGANLNYANLLLKADDHAAAIKHANAALAGMPRPGREQADKASRARAESLLAEAKRKLR